MKIYAGEVDAVCRVGVDPTEEEEALLIVDLPYVGCVRVHDTLVREAILSWYEEMSDAELVVAAQHSTECTESFNALIAIYFSMIKECSDEVARNAESPQSCRLLEDGRISHYTDFPKAFIGRNLLSNLFISFRF